MRSLHLDGVKYMLPNNWDELTTKQLEFLASLIIAQKVAQEIRVQMLLYCLKARVMKSVDDRVLICIKRKRFLMTVSDMVYAGTAFDFLFDENGRIYPKRTVNPYPVLKSRCREFYGPAQAMTDIFYEQYIYLQTYLEQITNGDAGAINQFIAVLWRKKGSEFDAENMRPHIFNHLPERRKMIILWFYYGTVDFLSNKYPLTFTGGDESNGGSVFENQMRVVNSLAKGVLSEKESVRRANMYDVFITIECALEDQDKLES